MQDTHNKEDKIIFCDGIAIFFIVLFHELGGQINNPLILLNPYLVTMGLSLFTFSSGYKLMINPFTLSRPKIFFTKLFY